MTPQEAISILNQACANLNGIRKDHQVLVQAIETLQTVIEPKPEEKNDGNKD